jgi:carboxypeptidase T
VLIVHGMVGRLRYVPLVGALVVTLLGAVAPAYAAAADFPPGYTAYHTYAEMVADLDSVVAAHPTIVRKFSIGRSYQGRELWAAKISDNVATNENEPEVVFDSLTHAREHITVEMDLYLLHLLADNYGHDSRITNIVNTREIFIIFMVNPDGGEYDISGGQFHSWRKNRQPIPNTTAIGVDLNRNFGFKWACCGGASNDPTKETYRGPSPWFAPEVVAFRDFVRSRVVGGRQQIRLAVTWHSSGKLVLWPYGYTTADVPKTMTADDHAAFVALGRAAGALNGYAAKQGSDLYITDGDQNAWTYHEQRIFQFTFEMGPGGDVSFYPTDDKIGTLTTVNRGAVLYLLEQADCPWRAAGRPTRCGPLNDDFEISRGWQVNPYGTDTATSGRWLRAIPQKTATAAGTKQKSRTTSGEADLVTGATAGSTANSNDVDGGLTSILSPPIKLAAGSWTLDFNYTFAHDTLATSADFMRIRVVSGTTRATVFSVAGAATERNAVWTNVRRSLDAYAGKTVRLLVEAADTGADSLLEAAIDDLRVYTTPGTAAGAFAAGESVHLGPRPV